VSRAVVVVLALSSLVAVAARGQTTPPESLREADRLFKEADRELNVVYQRCIDPQSNTVQAIGALRAAQRQWIDVRDGTARAYQLSQSDRHPRDDKFYTHARTIMTWGRIEELKALFGCE
jgi:uncharacterized protein YecT (DUF1311 family)